MSPSLQDIIRKRQSAAFFGRLPHREDYRTNLYLAPEDESRRFVYNIHGNAGVGKSLLLGEFQQIASRSGALTVRVDDDKTNDVIDVLNTAVTCLEQHGLTFKDFPKQHAEYQRVRNDLLAADDTPDDIATTLTHGLVHTGVLSSSLLAPDLADGFTRHLNVSMAASTVNEVRTWLTRKIKEPQTLRLLTDPVAELTRIFARELDKTIGDQTLALFFDTFENASPQVQAWLLTLIGSSEYGNLPSSIVVTIAGQHRPDPNAWSALWPVMANIELEPFTHDEVIELLARHNVTDAGIVQAIWEVTKGLPVLVDALAQASPDHPEEIVDSGGDAVERFLKWIKDPDQRSIAKLGALPRELNQDVLEVLLPESEREKAFDLYTWLRSLRFVTDQGGRCYYHQVVRSLMVRLQRNSSPSKFAHYNTKLAAYYQSIEENGSPIEEIYHLLCVNPAHVLPRALEGAVGAAGEGPAQVHRWVMMLEQAGHDGASPDVSRWSERLANALHGSDPSLACLTCLIEDAPLSDTALAKARAKRGKVLFYDLNRTEKALIDLTRAIELMPDYEWAIAVRGIAYRALGNYDEALTDLNRAIELRPDDVWNHNQRGRTYEAIGDCQAAIADYGRATELDPTYEMAFANRGIAYRALGNYDEALTDLNRAIELRPDDFWNHNQRGITYYRMGNHLEALADFDHVIEIESKYGPALLYKGLILLASDSYVTALPLLARAVKLEPQDTWALYLAGLTSLLINDSTKAHEYLKRAIEVGQKERENNPTSERSFFNPALCYIALDEPEEGVALIRKMLSASPNGELVTEALINMRNLRPLIREGGAEFVYVISLLAGYLNDSK